MLAAAAANEFARDKAYHEHGQDKAHGLNETTGPGTTAARTTALSTVDRAHGGNRGFPAFFSYNHNFLLFILLRMLYNGHVWIIAQ
jgi:hypothetical protein